MAGRRQSLRAHLVAMARSGFVIGVAIVTALSLGPTLRVVLAAMPVAASQQQASPQAESLATAEPQPEPASTATIPPGAELLVAGTPSADGYLLEVASAESGWQPQSLALLTLGPIDTRAWVGYQCVTGDGNYVVAVVAPWEASNKPALRDRGAVAFSVEIRTRKVTQLLDGVALKHFDPRCGDGSTAGLVRHLGVDQERSEALVVDAATGDLKVDAELDGQVVGVVPSGHDTYVFRDMSVARLDGDDEVDAQPTGGQPYMVAASPGGVSFLAADGDRAKVQRLADGDVTTLGTYALGEVKLHEGLGGDVTAVVRNAAPGDRADGLRWVRTDAAEPFPDAVSTKASTMLSSTEESPNELSATPGSPAPTEVVTNRAGDVLVQRARAQVDMSLPAEVLANQPSNVEMGALVSAAAANIDRPTCAVPRNNPNQMAPQASPDQVRWAIEQSVARNTGYVRPNHYLNQSWSPYAPAADFPVPDLVGPTKAVPASVAWATFVQESNWKQASRRSLPGASANPTIASYYGAPWDDPLSMIDYDEADCGYGLSQVTDGMRNDDGQRTEVEEDKIALDYFANASAGVQILAKKWNEITGTQNLPVNNGDARYLENWYAALWAYNTGWNANDGAGHFGLGWTNNPRNSDYPPDRHLFLRDDLDDSRHPSDWPYQERVFGWMENPLWKIGDPSQRFYPAPQGQGTQLKLPGINAMCTLADNNCNPNDNPGPTAYCQLADRHCWWHGTINFAGCGSTEPCAESVAPTRSNTEPAGDDNWPPNCAAPPPEASGTPGVVLIDDVPAGTTNVEGCPPAQTMGTFTPTFGRDLGGAPLAEIDWHQLGTGYDGHTWFTDNVHPGDTAHTVVGRWTPTTPLHGRYRVYVHVPAAGATTANAVYSVSTGRGITKATIDQGTYEDMNNAWAALGLFDFWDTGTYVELTNANGEPSGTTDVAFDAVAFVPQPWSPQERTSLIPSGSAWRYLDTGSVPSGWARSDFDDSSWPVGYAPLGSNATGVRQQINRLLPAHVTDLYRREFQVDSLQDVWALNLSLRYDDAVAVWLNGRLIYSGLLPTSPSPPDPNTLGLQCRGVPDQDNFENVTVQAPASGVQVGRNVIAVEVHQCGSSSDDAVFDAAVEGRTAPANDALALDGVFSVPGEDQIAAVRFSFYPQPNADHYTLYQLDYESGANAVPTVNNTVPGANGPDDRGKLTVSANNVIRRSLVSEFFLVTYFKDGGASLPSQAVRLLVIPNATRAADHSGPNIAWGFVGAPAALPETLPAAAPQALPSAAEAILPVSAEPAWGALAVVAVGAIVYNFLTEDVHVEARVPAQVLNVPMVFGNSNFVPTQAQVDQLTDKLVSRTMGPTAVLPATRTQVQTVARQCLQFAGRAGRSLTDCETMPILAPGEDDRPATNHYYDVVTNDPATMLLTRDFGEDQKKAVVPRTWYNSYDVCKTRPAGTDCDEYPFYTTAQNDGHSPPVYLKAVASAPNRHVGSVLSAMYGDTKCALRLPSQPLAADGGPFLVTPMPPGVTVVNTMYICGPAPTK